jgi:hypothetical protein
MRAMVVILFPVALAYSALSRMSLNIAATIWPLADRAFLHSPAAAGHPASPGWRRSKGLGKMMSVGDREPGVRRAGEDDISRRARGRPRKNVHGHLLFCPLRRTERLLLRPLAEDQLHLGRMSSPTFTSAYFFDRAHLRVPAGAQSRPAADPKNRRVVRDAGRELPSKPGARWPEAVSVDIQWRRAPPARLEQHRSLPSAKRPQT